MTLSDLRLIPTPIRTKPGAAEQRRMRLCMQIDRQIQGLRDFGVNRPIRGRWWTGLENDKLALSIMYGKVPLELAKGKHAIQCDDADQAIAALEKIKNIVVEGAFDDQLKAVSEALKARLDGGKMNARARSS